MAAEMGRSHEAPLIREPIACPPARWRRGLAGVARKEEGRRGDGEATEAVYWRSRGGRKRQANRSHYLEPA